MKHLMREHIKKQLRRLAEDRSYKLRNISPEAFSLLGPDGLGIPTSAVVDVKIVKAPKPIFKVFLENGQTFNLIDNGTFMQADINRILFDLDRDDDVNGAKYEMEKLMQQGKLSTDVEAEASDDVGASDDIGGESEEPAAEEPEV
jgi:hypothetical protein